MLVLILTLDVNRAIETNVFLSSANASINLKINADAPCEWALNRLLKNSFFSIFWPSKRVTLLNDVCCQPKVTVWSAVSLWQHEVDSSQTFEFCAQLKTWKVVIFDTNFLCIKNKVKRFYYPGKSDPFLSASAKEIKLIKPHLFLSIDIKSLSLCHEKVNFFVIVK